MEGDTAVIDEEECIRCAICHDVCPVDAVRHDGERIPQDVEANVAWANSLLDHEFYEGDIASQKDLVERLQRHFVKHIKVAEQTIERLRDIQQARYPD
jgi:ferredoxin